jgi:dephospho-CoA kinase
VTDVPFVGLTGGVGSGKSTALEVLERLGASTLSTDAVVHDLYASDEVRDAVVERFGPAVARDGAVDRAALAERAFATPEDRAWLEGLLWPQVGKRIEAWRAEQLERDPRPIALVVEVPLLFEAGMEGATRRSTSGWRASCPRTRRRPAPTTPSSTTARSRTSSATCRP